MLLDLRNFDLKITQFLISLPRRGRSPLVKSFKDRTEEALTQPTMISIIIGALGLMFVAGGIGLRDTMKSFGVFFAFVGVIFLAIAALGYFLPLTNHRQLILAGGVLLVFTLIAAVWQLIEKMRPPSQK